MRRLNKDYSKLALDYKREERYRARARGGRAAKCVICHQLPARDIIIPCEHSCICPGCMKAGALLRSGMTIC